MTDKEANDLPPEVLKQLRTSQQVKAIYSEMASRNKEFADHFVSGSRALMVAHGAGILLSSQLIGRTDLPPMIDPRTLLGLACLGFASAAVANFFSYYVAADAGRRYWEPRETSAISNIWLCGAPLLLSFLGLVVPVTYVGIKLLCS